MILRRPAVPGTTNKNMKSESEEHIQQAAGLLNSVMGIHPPFGNPGIEQAIRHIVAAAIPSTGFQSVTELAADNPNLLEYLKQVEGERNDALSRLSMIHGIVDEKDKEGIDILVGSTAMKSLLSWSGLSDAPPPPPQKFGTVIQAWSGEGMRVLDSKEDAVEGEFVVEVDIFRDVIRLPETPV
jgi:hypothetical protein